jgi:hypothetical protein
VATSESWARHNLKFDGCRYWSCGAEPKGKIKHKEVCRRIALSFCKSKYAICDVLAEHHSHCAAYWHLSSLVGSFRSIVRGECVLFHVLYHALVSRTHTANTFHGRRSSPSSILLAFFPIFNCNRFYCANESSDVHGWALIFAQSALINCKPHLKLSAQYTRKMQHLRVVNVRNEARNKLRSSRRFVCRFGRYPYSANSYKTLIKNQRDVSDSPLFGFRICLSDIYKMLHWIN